MMTRAIDAANVPIPIKKAKTLPAPISWSKSMNSVVFIIIRVLSLLFKINTRKDKSDDK